MLTSCSPNHLYCLKKKKKKTPNPKLPLLSPKCGVTKRSRGVFPLKGQRENGSASNLHDPSNAMTRPKNFTGAGAAAFADQPGSGPAGRQPPSPPASHKGEWFSPEHHPAPDPAQLGEGQRAGERGGRWVMKTNLRASAFAKTLGPALSGGRVLKSLPEQVPALPFQPAFQLTLSENKAPSGGAWPALASI